MRFYFMTLGIVSLAACSGGEFVPQYDAFSDPDSQKDDTLNAVTLTPATRTAISQSGLLDRINDTFSLGSLSGVIDAGRTEVTLDDGGVITLDSGENAHSVRFTAMPQNGDQMFGVVGIPTQILDLPDSGSASYAGTSVLTIQDGIALYELSGDSTVEASFAAGTVTTVLDSLDGTVLEGFGGAVGVTDIGAITMADSAMDGAGFNGGKFTISSDVLSNLSENAETELTGAFFGPEAGETGGVFVVDDSSEGNLIIFGDFIAKTP